MKKTVLVTGGNRGIGLEICRQLDAMGHVVIMGSRIPEKGQQAAAQTGGSITVHQLDVTDQESIHRFFTFVRREFAQLDVLINNAGIGAYPSGRDHGMTGRIREVINLKMPVLRPVARNMAAWMRKHHLLAEEADAITGSPDTLKYVMETNVYGPLRMIKAFLPLMPEYENSRIINISSGMGLTNNLTGAYPAYSLSKASLNALTIMFANLLLEKRIRVNAMCPGWVRTDMGGPDAPRSIPEGADTAVWLATAVDIPTGKFFIDRKEMEW